MTSFASSKKDFDVVLPPQALCITAPFVSLSSLRRK